MSEAEKSVRFAPVPVGNVDMFWDTVAPMLEKATKAANGRSSIDDVFAGIMDGTYILWVAVVDKEIVAAVTSRIVQYPQCRAMALDWIGGSKMKDWIGIGNEILVRHAKHNGCTHMEGYGRAAWIRWNGRYGWKEDYTAFRLEI